MHSNGIKGFRAVFGGITLWACIAILSCQAESADRQSARRCPPMRENTGSAREVIRYLTDPRLEGRGTGTFGDRCTSEFVASRFRELELKPLDAKQGFLQPVPLSKDWEYRGEPAGAWNVVGVLEGRVPSAGVIVVGAHHDHLGIDSEETVYPGADDNASGVAALLVAAEHLSKSEDLDRTVVFITFTGEETSLRGSKHYLAERVVPLTRPSLMINLDMVGRLRGSSLQISGLSTLEADRDVVLSTLSRGRIQVEVIEPVQGFSDHRSFADFQIPVLRVTTGSHADYHQPSDTFEKIDLGGVEAVGNLIARVVAELGSSGGPRL